MQPPHDERAGTRPEPDGDFLLQARGPNVLIRMAGDRDEEEQRFLRELPAVADNTIVVVAPSVLRTGNLWPLLWEACRFGLPETRGPGHQLWLAVPGLGNVEGPNGRWAAELSSAFRVDVVAPEEGVEWVAGGHLYAGGSTGESGWRFFRGRQPTFRFAVRWRRPYWEALVPPGPTTTDELQAEPIPAGLYVRSRSEQPIPEHTGRQVRLSDTGPRVVLDLADGLPTPEETALLVDRLPPGLRRYLTVVPVNGVRPLSDWASRLAALLDHDVVLPSVSLIRGRDGSWRPAALPDHPELDAHDQLSLRCHPPLGRPRVVERLAVSDLLVDPEVEVPAETDCPGANEQTVVLPVVGVPAAPHLEPGVAGPEDSASVADDPGDSDTEWADLALDQEDTPGGTGTPGPTTPARPAHPDSSSPPPAGPVAAEEPAPHTHDAPSEGDEADGSASTTPPGRGAVPPEAEEPVDGRPDAGSVTDGGESLRAEEPTGGERGPRRGPTEHAVATPLDAGAPGDHPTPAGRVEPEPDTPGAAWPPEGALADGGAHPSEVEPAVDTGPESSPLEQVSTGHAPLEPVPTGAPGTTEAAPATGGPEEEAGAGVDDEHPGHRPTSAPLWWVRHDPERPARNDQPVEPAATMAPPPTTSASPNGPLPPGGAARTPAAEPHDGEIRPSVPTAVVPDVTVAGSSAPLTDALGADTGPAAGRSRRDPGGGTSSGTRGEASASDPDAVPVEGTVEHTANTGNDVTAPARPPETAPADDASADDAPADDAGADDAPTPPAPGAADAPPAHLDDAPPGDGTEGRARGGERAADAGRTGDPDTGAHPATGQPTATSERNAGTRPDEDGPDGGEPRDREREHAAGPAGPATVLPAPERGSQPTEPPAEAATPPAPPSDPDRTARTTADEAGVPRTSPRPVDGGSTESATNPDGEDGRTAEPLAVDQPVTRPADTDEHPRAEAVGAAGAGEVDPAGTRTAGHVNGPGGPREDHQHPGAAPVASAPPVPPADPEQRRPDVEADGGAAVTPTPAEVAPPAEPPVIPLVPVRPVTVAEPRPADLTTPPAGRHRPADPPPATRDDAPPPAAPPAPAPDGPAPRPAPPPGPTSPSTPARWDLTFYAEEPPTNETRPVDPDAEQEPPAVDASPVPVDTPPAAVDEPPAPAPEPEAPASEPVGAGTQDPVPAEGTEVPEPAPGDVGGRSESEEDTGGDGAEGGGAGETAVAWVPPDHRSTEAERAALARLVGEDYENALATVNAALAMSPVLRGAGGEAAKADFVAVCLYLAHEGYGGRVLNDALRSDGGRGWRDLVACLTSGLRRLPVHRGATFQQAHLPDDGARLREVCPPAEVLDEPGFVSATAVHDLNSPDANVDLLIWSTTGRRVGMLGAGGLPEEVVFFSRSRFKVLDVVGGAATRPAVLARELRANETSLGIGLDEVDAQVLARLRRALSRRQRATLRDLTEDETFGRWAAPFGLTGPAAPLSSPATATATAGSAD